MTKPNVLCIDARPLARGSGGIQRYLQEILPFIAKSGLWNIYLYCDQAIEKSWSARYSNIHVRNPPKILEGPLSWHFFVARWVKKDKPKVFWSPRHHLPLWLPRNVKKTVTIHDLVWKTAPNSMKRSRLIVEKVLMPLSMKRADAIICVSRTTKNKLIEFFPDYSRKCEVILHGQDIKKVQHRPSASSNRDYYLAVGTIEPRKNYVLLIRAFDRYVDNGGLMKLVIIGAKGWRYKNVFDELSRSNNHGKISVLNNVSDRTLKKYYSEAAAYISTSLDEGYGLPAQEANSFGLPMALSNIDVFRELFSSADLWFEPNSEIDIAEKLKLLETISVHSDNSEPNISPPSKSWKECSAQHLKTLSNIK